MEYGEEGQTYKNLRQATKMASRQSMIEAAEKAKRDHERMMGRLRESQVLDEMEREADRQIMRSLWLAYASA